MKSRSVRNCHLLLESAFICFLFLLPGCAPVKCGYSVNKLYTARGFDSRTISGRSVIMMPLLKKQGIDTVGSLSDTSLMRTVGDLRTDLNFVSFRQQVPYIKKRCSEKDLYNFIDNLFTGKIPVLQTADSIWQLLNADFMSVIRLKGGHIVRTFEGDTHKKIIVEGELWDCKKAEVVARIVINGICVTAEIADDHFIADAVKEFFRELPLSAPAYDTQAW